MPTAGGVCKALEHGRRIGCESIQLFVKNNMQWLSRPIAPAEVQLFASLRAACGFASVFGHTGYLINLAAAPSPNRDRSIESLIQEIQLATELGLPFLVMHPGSHLGHGEAAGIENVVKGLDEVLTATRNSTVRIALEDTAGQGTSLGYVLSHLTTIFDRVQRPSRLGLCLDTAHLFAAGHDLRRRKVWTAALDEIESRVGIDQVLACHLNDSKTDLGSRVDRHAGIGQGRIGREAFRHIVNEPRFRDLPACLETPKSPDLHEDIQNLAILRALQTGWRAPQSRFPAKTPLRKKRQAKSQS